MGTFSDRIRGNQKGTYKVADFEDRKELTYTISHLDEDVVMFGKTIDLLNFNETGRQFQLNQTNSEWLLDTFGDDPNKWEGQRVTLYLAEYSYGDKTGQTIRLRKADDKPKPAAPARGDGTTRTRSPDRKDDLDDSIPF